jgi:S-adenosylmethionine hydrolase
MVLTFTDFGAGGPYLGQVEAVLRSLAPGIDVIHLVSDAPTSEPIPSGYLLAALSPESPVGSVFLCVVDPGVGGARDAMVLEADGRWYVGPDNGLLNPVAAQARTKRWVRIDWRPERFSRSFHGRDLFAPVAARIAMQDWNWAHTVLDRPELESWPADFASVIYFDHYGNAFTGLRHRPEFEGRILFVNGQRIGNAEVFCAVQEGTAFWYRNSVDLVEIAVNRGRARDQLGLKIGDKVVFGA